MVIKRDATTGKIIRDAATGEVWRNDGCDCCESCYEPCGPTCSVKYGPGSKVSVDAALYGCLDCKFFTRIEEVQLYETDIPWVAALTSDPGNPGWEIETTAYVTEIAGNGCTGCAADPFVCAGAPVSVNVRVEVSILCTGFGVEVFESGTNTLLAVGSGGREFSLAANGTGSDCSYGTYTGAGFDETLVCDDGTGDLEAFCDVSLDVECV